jgi:hypothetical protein
MVDGISRTGASAEDQFRQLTGFEGSDVAAKGDFRVTVEGQVEYVEVKKCSSNTINQVRAIKFIPLVVYDERRDGRWYVIDPVSLVRYAAQRGRGQHTEIPFESMTLNISQWAEYRVPADQLGAAVVRAILQGRSKPRLKEAMTALLNELTRLSDRQKRLVLEILTESEGR